MFVHFIYSYSKEISFKYYVLGLIQSIHGSLIYRYSDAFEFIPFLVYYFTENILLNIVLV